MTFELVTVYETKRTKNKNKNKNKNKQQTKNKNKNKQQTKNNKQQTKTTNKNNKQKQQTKTTNKNNKQQTTNKTTNNKRKNYLLSFDGTVKLRQQDQGTRGIRTCQGVSAVEFAVIVAKDIHDIRTCLEGLRQPRYT